MPKRRRPESPSKGGRRREGIKEWLRKDKEREELEKNHPELKEKRIIEQETRSLRHHIEDYEKSRGIIVNFFLEEAPSHHTGARCSLYELCDKYIKPGDHRIAVVPGQLDFIKGKPDFYHVHCFERIADHSDANYLHRMEVLIGRNAAGRDGQYFNPHPVAMLFVKWKDQRKSWIAMRELATRSSKHEEKVGDGTEQGREENQEENQEVNQEENQKEHHEKEDAVKGGDEKDDYKKDGHEKNDHGDHGREDRNEHFGEQGLEGEKISEEEDGLEDEDDEEDDEEQWDLIKEYLDDDPESLNDRHALSSMLSTWEVDLFLATAPDEELSEECKKYKANLGKKAIDAIKGVNVAINVVYIM